MFLAIVTGVVLGQAASRITQYFTSSQFKPVRDIADAGRTGPATVVLSGISSGMESAVWAVVAIAVAILVGLGPGRRQLAVRLLHGGPHRHRHAGHHRHRRGRGHLRTRSPTTRRASPRCPTSSRATPRRSSTASTRSATPPRRSPRASPSARRSSPPSRCSPRSARPSPRPLRPRPATPPRVRGPEGVRPGVHQHRRSQDLRRRAHRRHRRVPVLVARHPGRGPHRRHRRAGGPAPVPGEARDHGLHREARLRPGHRHLHHAPPCGSSSPRRCWRCSCRSSSASASGKLRARRLPGRHHRRRCPHGQLPVQRRRRVGQRQEVHRGGQPRRQGLRRPQGRRHRRHRRRPVQGHRRPGHQPAASR